MRLAGGRRPWRRSSLRAKNFWVVALVGSLSLSGCGDGDGGEIRPPIPEGQETPIRVVAVELGRSVDAEMRVNDGLASDEFAPSDTVYASVMTEGSLGNAIVAARWLDPNGEIISESARAISPTRTMVMAFQLADPDGFEPGRYTVAIVLDGNVVERKEFVIR